MKKYLYHGSAIGGIAELKANSKLHSTQTDVLYLTDSLPYSLFYIWDPVHNLKNGKHVTAWIKNGIVYYEEQFRNQLGRFYEGVGGYVYTVENTADFNRVPDRESMWYSKNNAGVCKTQYFSNVYEEIQKYVSAGLVKLIAYEEADKDRIKRLYESIADGILRKGLLEAAESGDAMFYQTFFGSAWEMAVSMALKKKKTK